MLTTASAIRSVLKECAMNCEVQKLPPKYDKHCMSLTKEEIKAKLDAGVPYVIRQNMPVSGTTSFDDAVFGRITVENSAFGRPDSA